MSQKELKPTEDRIVVKRLESDEKSAGGIIIPDTAKEKPVEGEVLAVGPGRRKEDGSFIPVSLSVGDKILFTKWSGTEIKFNNQDILVMKETDVLAVIK